MPFHFRQRNQPGNGRLFLVAAATAGLVLAMLSCQVPATGPVIGGSMMISISADTARTLVPSIDMNPAGYDIIGTGPTGSTFTQSTSSPSATISGLAFGSWTVTVNGKNATGTVIGQGTGTTTVVTGQVSTLAVTVTPLQGMGVLSLTTNWTPADVLVPQINAQLIPQSGSPITLPFTIGTGTASSQTSNLAAGYYTLTLQLLDNGYLVMGAVEVVRIIQGQTTSGTFDFTQVNRAVGSIAVGITPVLSDPLTVTLSGQSATLSVGTSMTVTAATTGYTGNVTYVWYVNGVSSGTGSNASPSFTVGSALTVGIYRLDVTCITADGTRAGSATTTFQVQ